MPEKLGGIGIRNLLFLKEALIDKWLQRFCPFSFTWGVLMGIAGRSFKGWEKFVGGKVLKD